MTVFTKIGGLLLPTKNKVAFILQGIPGALLLSTNTNTWTAEQKGSLVAVTQQNIYDTAYLLTNMVEANSLLTGSSSVIMLYVPSAQQIINK
jgi:hypothetical protein